MRPEGILGRPPFERIALILQGGGTLCHRQARSDRAMQVVAKEGRTAAATSSLGLRRSEPVKHEDAPEHACTSIQQS